MTSDAAASVVVPDLTVTGRSFPENDSAGAEVVVELSEPTTVPVTFTVTTVEGSATPDIDYSPQNASGWTIDPGDTVALVHVTFLNDEIAEPDESFDVVIGGIVGANPINTTTVTVTILNDDLLQVLISSNPFADGSAVSTTSPFQVREFNVPNSLLTFDVVGGVGPYKLSVVSAPSLGALNYDDPGGGSPFDLVPPHEPLSFTAADGVSVDFVGVPQSTASFEWSDAFIIVVTDLGDTTITSGSIIVELEILPVNQPVVVVRDGLAFVASGSVVNIPLVDGAGGGDPSIFDTDGDNLVFENPMSDNATVTISGSTLVYVARPFDNVAGVSPFIDTVTFGVLDDGEPAATAVSASLIVEVHPVAEMFLNVSASDGSFSRDLRLGVGPDGPISTGPGTTGSITELTAVQAPPEAPGTSFRAWIPRGGALLRDIQPINNAETARSWPIHVRTGAPADGSSLTWFGPEVNALVEQLNIQDSTAYSAFITDTATQEIWELTGDGTGSIPLANNQSYDFDVTFTQSVESEPFIGSLVAGWNLVSIPGIGDLSDLDLKTNGAFVWEGQYRGVGFLTQAEVPAVTTGVFINSNGDTYTVNADVDSSAIRSVTVNLADGWNLIGAPSTVGGAPSFPASNVTAQFTNKAAVFGYNSTSRSYTLASQLDPGAGYWVYNDTGTSVPVQLTQPRHLGLDGSSLFHPAGVTTAPALSGLDWSLPVSLAVDDGTLRTVQLGLSSDASIGYDRFDVAMPPPPPMRTYSHLYVGVDDAVGRLTRSVQAMERSGTEWVMNARIDGASGVIEWRRPNVPEHWRLTMEVGGTRVDMAERQSLRLGAGTYDLRVMLTWVVPTTTRLMPNYPNPFNPETWIPFELTQAADVTVRVYGQDGSVVRTLALGYRAEGYYTGVGDAAYWDGRNELGEQVASGVYLYELQAGDYRAMRRMVIMK